MHHQLALAAVWLALASPAHSSPSTQQILQENPLAKWNDCGTINGHTVECSRIDVPMDHFNKSSEKTFSIPLIRLLATNASSTGHTNVLLNPGGPGGSGVNFLWRAGEMLNKVFGEGFNLLSFDPRGVNGSIPQAFCYVSPEQRAQKFINTPWNLHFEAGEMYTQAENNGKACADTMGEHGAYVNTPQTAADMNSILDAIGQEKLYYWGGSYGTILGQTYAQMYPERVARLIIDGVANLHEWYNTTHYNESLVDTDNVFAGFIEECFKAKENCPVNSIKGKTFSTASDLQVYIDQFLVDLDENPIPVYINNTNYGAVRRLDVVTSGIFPALYKPTLWPLLAKNLAALFNGDPMPVYEQYSDSTWITSILTDETNTFVRMNDNWLTGAAAPYHSIKAIKNHALNFSEYSTLASRYQGSDLFERSSWIIPTTHTFNPHFHPEDKTPRFKTAHPILVISTSYDPVCPLASAKKAWDAFEGAGFVEQKSYGHCTLSMPSLCMAKHLRRYFNEGVVPEKGASCGIDAEYFPGKKASEVKTLDQEDVELLAALEELALVDIL